MRPIVQMFSYDRRLWLALVASALAHITLVLIFSLYSSEIPEAPQPITFEYAERPETHSAMGEGKGHKKGGRKPISLSDLVPKIALGTPSTSPVDETLDEAGWTDSHTYDRVDTSANNGMTMEQIDFVRSLWRVIDQSISDNPFLSEYNHTGKVFFRFEVDKNGHLENRSFHASALDRVLKVIAARAVRTALRNETGDVHFAHQRMLINARFTWSSYGACETLRGYWGNFLSFCHYAENKRKSFSTGERISDYAGAIWQHGPWAGEEIKNYNREERRRNAEFDPFEDLERDPDWNL